MYGFKYVVGWLVGGEFRNGDVEKLVFFRR